MKFGFTQADFGHSGWLTLVQRMANIGKDKQHIIRIKEKKKRRKKKWF